LVQYFEHYYWLDEVHLSGNPLSTTSCAVHIPALESRGVIVTHDCPCIDNDNDGYGAYANETCTYPEEDCDDSNADVNPGATEGPEGDPTSSDGLDNDCDGIVDDQDGGCILVNFPDPNLEAAVREAINKPTGDVMASDLLGLDSLRADGSNISDLTGLEYCSGVWQLYLHNNQISDISPLAGLTGLSDLYLNDNQIGDISPLVDKPWYGVVDSVDLRGNPLSTTSCTTYIPQLERRGVAVTHDCLYPATHRIVFVTAGLYDGNLGGLSGADAICQLEAESASLTGTFKAWLSDSNASPETRFTTAPMASYVLVDGTPVANDWEDLTDGVIIHPIDQTANGTLLSSAIFVWTGTSTDGTSDISGSYCSDWTDELSPDAGITGSLIEEDYQWTRTHAVGCTSPTLHLYCFQQ